MITTVELLKKLIGKHIVLSIQPGGNYFMKESKKKGEYIVTDVGDQFIEAKSSSSGDTSKHYFNMCSIQQIILLE